MNSLLCSRNTYVIVKMNTFIDVKLFDWCFWLKLFFFFVALLTLICCVILQGHRWILSVRIIFFTSHYHTQIMC